MRTSILVIRSVLMVNMKKLLYWSAFPAIPTAKPAKQHQPSAKRVIKLRLSRSCTFKVTQLRHAWVHVLPVCMLTQQLIRPAVPTVCLPVPHVQMWPSVKAVLVVHSSTTAPALMIVQMTSQLKIPATTNAISVIQIVPLVPEQQQTVRAVHRTS